MSYNYFSLVLDAVAATGSDGVPSGILVKDLFTDHVPKLLWDIIWMRMRRHAGDFVYCEADPVQHASIKDPNNSKENMWYYPVIPLNSPKLRSLKSAINNKVRVQPSDEMYDGYLEIYGNKLQRFKYSDTQRKTLLLLKDAGLHGVPQNELSSALGKGNNNFGYVMATLEERGKIFKKKANVKATKNGKQVTMTTSIVWLSCFKPSIETAIATSNEMHITGSKGEIHLVEFVQDEDAFKRILEYLDSVSPPGTALEGTVKHDLGYQSKAGHKVWRRIRDKMIELGLIKCFDGILESDGRSESFIKKLKNFETERAPEVFPKVVERPPRLPCNQLVELSLDRQLLLEIIKCGSEGAKSSDLGAHLGLSLKKHSVRFIDLIDNRFQDAGGVFIKTVKVSVDRSAQMAYRASDKAVEIILHANMRILPDGFATQASRSRDSEGASTDIGLSIVEAPPVYYSEDGRAYPEIFGWRLSWLVNAVNEKGFFLSQQASSYLLEQEKVLRSRIGGEVPKELDHKTVVRIADKAEKDNKLKIIEVQVPSRSGISGPQNVTVYLAHGLELSDDMYHRILKSYEESFQNRMQKKQENLNIPLIAGEFKKPTNTRVNSFNIYKIQQENGYHSSKVLRCQVIAEAISRMIESRSNYYVTSRFEGLLMATKYPGSGEIRCIEEIPEKKIQEMGELHSKTQEISLFEPSNANKRLVFTREELWNALTVQDFILALGSTCEDKHYLLRNKMRYLSDLTEDELKKLAGNIGDIFGAEKHFRDVLYMLVKLGVLKSIGVIGKFSHSEMFAKTSSGDHGIYYMLNNVVSIEQERDSKGLNTSDPTRQTVSERKILSFSFADANERRGYWISLQFLFANLPRPPLDSVDPNIRHLSQQQKACFPADRVFVDRSLGRSVLSTEETEKIRAAIANESINIDEISADWRQIDALSARWGVPVEAVVRGVSDMNFKSKKSIRRLLGLQSGEKESSYKKHKKRNRQIRRGSDVSPIEEEEEELILLHPEEMAPPTRKRKWLENEDRELLYAWVRWLVSNGIHSRIRWKTLTLPPGMRPTSWQNRISRLLSDDYVKDHMTAIREESNAVFKRQASKGKVKKKQTKKNYIGPDIFDAKCDDDLQSIQVIASEIEKVIKRAPERPADVNEATSARLERLAKSHFDGSSPVEYFLWLRSYLSKSKVLSGNVSGPNIEVTAAISMLLSLLYEIEYLGKSSEQVKNILCERFSAETLRDAMKHLLQNDLIASQRMPNDMGKMQFHLSTRFKSEIRPPFAPLMLVEDKELLLKTKVREIWPLSRLICPISLAPILSAAIMGHAIFLVSVPNDLQDAFESSKMSENISYRLGEHCLHRNMASIRIKEIGGAIQSPPVREISIANILYQPKDVLDNSQEYKIAKASFIEESTKVFGANVGNSILETISKAGPNGVSMESLYSLLQHNSLSADSTTIEMLLQKYGLARILKGYNDTYVVSTLTSRHLVITRKNRDAAKGASPPIESKSCRKMKEIPLRPWIDTDGNVIIPFWQSLVMRVIDVVSRFPAINGELLIESLRVLPPQFAKEIISILWKEQVLYYLDSRSTINRVTMSHGVFSESFKYSSKERDNSMGWWTKNSREPPFASKESKDFFFFVNPNKISRAMKITPSYE